MRLVSAFGPAAAPGVRRLAPALCAALLVVPLVSLPLVAGTALADTPLPAVTGTEQAPEQAPDVLAETAAAWSAEVPEIDGPDAPESAAVEDAVEDAADATLPADVEDSAAAEDPAAAENAAEVDLPADATAQTGGDTGSEVDGDIALLPPVALDRTDDEPGPTPDGVARPDVFVALDGPAESWAGGEDALTLTVGNARTATAPATGFTVVYTAPPGQTVLSVETPWDSAWACALSAEASCTWGAALAAGEQAPPVTVVVGHGRRASGTLSGVATVTHLADEVVLADNRATVDTVLTAPELAVNLGVPDTAAVGDALRLVLSVTNVGPGWASGFTVLGALPPGVEVSELGGPGYACDVDTRSCMFTGELGPGLSAGVTVSGALASSYAGGPLTTTAHVEPGALVASAVTEVPVVAAPPAPEPEPAPEQQPAPVVVPQVPAVSPVRVSPVVVNRPVTAVAAAPARAVAPASRKATPVAASAEAPAMLAFTGSRTDDALSGGLALLLVGLVLTLAARRRTA